MSWGEPKALRAFTRDSPFFGLPLPQDVDVTSQVVAQPDPDLAERTIASLADGTPLVTRKALGDGQIVLFHVTANAEWSTLPLSGLFVQMLERLAISTRPSDLNIAELAGTVWTPQDFLDGFGRVRNADALGGVAGELLADPVLGPNLRPGLYANADRRVALNVMGTEDVIVPAVWPGSITVEGMRVREETPLTGVVLTTALGLLMLDIIASLALAGRLTLTRAAPLAMLLLFVSLPADRVMAQSADGPN